MRVHVHRNSISYNQQTDQHERANAALWIVTNLLGC